jgi:hypothetical protein
MRIVRPFFTSFRRPFDGPRRGRPESSVFDIFISFGIVTLPIPDSHLFPIFFLVLSIKLNGPPESLLEGRLRFPANDPLNL